MRFVIPTAATLVLLVSVILATPHTVVDPPVLVLVEPSEPTLEGDVATATGLAWDPVALPVSLSASIGDISGPVTLDVGTFVESEVLLSSRLNYDVALGDLDGDGDLDAFVVSGSVQVWRNDGPGQWSQAFYPTLTSVIYGVALADLDGDDDLDAVLATATGSTVLRNDGALTFTHTPTMGSPFGSRDVRSVALGDLDGDMDVDAVLAIWDSWNEVWLNDGTGTFTLGPLLGVSANTHDVALGDLDADGDLDIAEAYSLNNNLWWQNDGTGVFPITGMSLLPGLAADSQGIAIGDMNGDTLLDIVVVNYSGVPDELLLNNGTSFSQSVFGASFGIDIALGDLDADGSLDVWVADRYDDGLWLNDGAGTLVDSGQTLSSLRNRGVALANLDQDGDIDVFLASFGYDSIWWNGGSPNWVWTYEIADGPDDSQPVTVTATNGEAESTVVFNLEAVNKAPVLSPPATQVALPGVVADIPLGSLIDPGDDAPWILEVDWGDGSPLEFLNIAAAGALGSLPHAWAVSQAATVSLTVTDDGGSGAMGSATFLVEVLGPQLTVADSSARVNAMQPVRLGSFIDNGGAGPWQVTVNWGDGSLDDSFQIDQEGDLGAREHTFARLGDHVVTVTLAQVSGNGIGQESFVVSVIDLAVPLNPEGLLVGDVKSFELNAATGRIVFSAKATDGGSTNLYSIPDEGGTPVQLNNPAHPIGAYRVKSAGTRVVWRDSLGLRSSLVGGGGVALLDDKQPATILEMIPDGTSVIYDTIYVDQLGDNTQFLNVAAADGSTGGAIASAYVYYEGLGITSMNPSSPWFAYKKRDASGGCPSQSLYFYGIGLGGRFGGSGGCDALGSNVSWVGDSIAMYWYYVNGYQSVDLNPGGALTALPGAPRAATPIPVEGDYQFLYTAGSELYSAPVRGGTPRLLVSDVGTTSYFKITPDGLTSVYKCGSSICRVGTLSGPAVVLVENFGGTLNRLEISPDGQSVVYRVDNELTALPIGGGTPRLLHEPLPPGSGVTDDIVFHPDGQSVTFIVDDRQPGRFELLDSPLASGAPRRLNGPLQPDGDVTDFQWSADGRFLVYRADQNFDEVYDLFRVDGHCDAAEPDDDGDGIANRCDLCPLVADLDQANQDGDPSGDVCDNCPDRFNASQADDDDDGRGNACDPCLNDPDDAVEVFSDTVLATDRDRFAWTAVADVKVVRGTLAAVRDYAPLDYVLLASTDSIVAEGAPAAGSGWYYLVGPQDCGSWQVTPGDAPDRDLYLP